MHQQWLLEINAFKDLIQFKNLINMFSFGAVFKNTKLNNILQSMDRIINSQSNMLFQQVTTTTTTTTTSTTTTSTSTSTSLAQLIIHAAQMEANAYCNKKQEDRTEWKKMKTYLTTLRESQNVIAEGSLIDIVLRISSTKVGRNDLIITCNKVDQLKNKNYKLFQDILCSYLQLNVVQRKALDQKWSLKIDEFNKLLDRQRRTNFSFSQVFGLLELQNILETMKDIMKIESLFFILPDMSSYKRWIEYFESQALLIKKK